MTTYPADYFDACGECPRGECDDCEVCRYFAAAPWRNEALTITTDADGWITSMEPTDA